jgi:hypothetical protein
MKSVLTHVLAVGVGVSLAVGSSAVADGLRAEEEARNLAMLEALWKTPGTRESKACDGEEGND